MTEPTAPSPARGGASVSVLAGVAAVFVAALLGLLGYKTGLWPWQLPWLEDGRPAPLLVDLLHESRHEIAALALAALNLGWVLLRLARAEKVDPLPQPPSVSSGLAEGLAELVAESRDADGLGGIETLDTVDADSDSDAVADVDTGATASASAQRGAARVRDEVQLQIAAAELNRLRRELIACRRELEIANAAKTRFLANMSHELRTPMNGIMGMTDLLLGGDLEPRARRFAQSIATSANTLLGIINDLLDFSKIEAGTLQLERSRFRVHDAVEDVCEMLAANAHAKGVELVCYVDDNVPQLADGDASRLRQILDNLVRNAIAFTAEGEIVVRMTRTERRGKRSLYRCDVEDTGAGIPPELQMTMFDAFTQEDSSKTRRHGGLGMGLTITRELVAMMGGTIVFRSRLGEGSRFSFTVELDDVEGTEEDELRSKVVRGARVLVVDDNETNRTILYHQLSGWGVVADTVESGEAALARMRVLAEGGQRYDALVLDLHMPGMDGVELARQISRDPALAGTRSLMLTSALLELDAQELAALGVERYISKPPRQSVLHESLVSLLPHGAVASADAGVAMAGTAPQVGANVLLVEDNPVNQDVATGMLERVGCHVELARDGREAVERAGQERFDLILMDCQMPEMDGYTATGKIRSEDGENTRTPIVALTANAMEGDRERCLAAGMDDYLSKPVRQEDLQAALLRWTPTATPEEATPEEAASEEAAMPAADADGGANADAGAGADAGTSAGAGADTDADADVGIGADGTGSGANATPGTEGISVVAEMTAIDQKAIETIRALQRPGKPDLLGKVVGIYLERTPESVGAMREALDAADFAALKAQAHGLKSSSAYLGAGGLAELCRRIEEVATTGDADAAARFVATLEEAYAVVAEKLGGMSRAA